MRAANHLVIFARAPRLGAVKRRLAADIGDLGASRFYRQTLAGVLRRLGRDRRWRTWLAVTPDRFARAPGMWRAAAGRAGLPPLLPQGGGDLGARMPRPFDRLPPGPVVIVGCDIPDLNPAHVARAFAALGRHDAVFGPATDGGYWLVGLRRRALAPDLFRGVRWSSELALADTLANLDWRQKVALIERLDDVDDAESYRRWRAASREGGQGSGGDPAPVTGAARR